MQKRIAIFFLFSLFQIHLLSAAGVGSKISADLNCSMAGFEKTNISKLKNSGSSKQEAKSKIFSNKLAAMRKKYGAKSKYVKISEMEKWTVSTAVDYIYSQKNIKKDKSFNDYCVSKYMATH